MFEEIISSLSRNKLRTALTGFSVSWGIFILIVLLAAGNGFVHSVDNVLAGNGLSTMTVHPGWTSKEYQGWPKDRRILIDENDMNAIENKLSANVDQIIPVVSKWGSVNYGMSYLDLSVKGVTLDYLDFQNLEIIKGRFINRLDIDDNRRVCVLHEEHAQTLFFDADPLGKKIKFNGMYYQVVGVYKTPDWNHDMLAPYTTIQSIYNSDSHIDELCLKFKHIDSEEDCDNLSMNIRQVVGERRYFDKTDDNALWTWASIRNYLSISKFLGVVITSVWVIGLLTLISGIVGVSNIMLITVKERTHEFGIRKALGAKPYTMLMQVVTESVIITAVFGYIGMVAGIGLSEVVGSMLDSQNLTFFKDPTVDLHIAIEATLVLIVAGTLAGFFPARRAVNIKPIEALRES